MIIVDSHCHLDMLTEYDCLDRIVKRAADNDVQYLQTICTKLDQCDHILTIARKYDNVYASVGVHPSEVQSVVDAKTLLELSNDKKVIGIGETGLDYFYNKDANQLIKQKQSFEQHIVTAQTNGLPLIIHMRDAESDTIDVLSSHKKNKDFSGLIHCFTASKTFAKQVLDLGMYISISGIITFKNAEELREVVRYLPVERLLVETDAPYLAPVPKRGKTNEPSYTTYVLEFLAELKGISTVELASITTDNFFKLFSKAQKKVSL